MPSMTEVEKDTDNDVVAVIPVYPKSEGDDELVNAIILNEDDEVQSNEPDDTDVGEAQCVLEESVEVAMDGDEDSDVACAVVVDAGIDTRSDLAPKDKEQVITKAEESPAPAKANKRKRSDSIPSVKDLGIPFRAIKRIMKVDPDIMVVQNEAAIITTYALELFVQKIVNETYMNAKKRGRNTVKYEDLAETRATHNCMDFLETLLP